MQLYIDTANLEEVRKAAETGLIDGVTTNPSWIAKEGLDFKKVVKEIVKILKKHTKDFTVSAEVNSEDWEDMVKEGQKYAKWSKYVVVKVPLTRDGLIACKKLTEKKVRCNVTLCFNANQALLAAKAGAYFISPFIGRVERAGLDGMGIIAEIRQLYDQHGFDTKILAASVHEPSEVKQAALLGADICTMYPKVFWQLYESPFTDAGLKAFQEDYHKYKVAMEKKDA